MVNCTSIFGVCFDIINVLIALADQATDIVIIYQLRTTKSHTVGADAISALILTFVCVANVAATFGWMVRIARSFRFDSEKTAVLWFFVFLLVSPLLPLLNFILSTCYPDSFRGINEVDWNQAALTIDREHKNDNSNDETKRKKKEEGKKAEKATASKDLFASLVGPQHAQLEALDGGIARRAGSYSLFGLLCCAESIPNAILVLIYLSLNDGANIDWPILLSLLLSLSSIAVKSFVLARSATISGVVFKSLIVIFDVFMVAFLAASLFQQEGNEFVSATNTTNATTTAATTNTTTTAAAAAELRGVPLDATLLGSSFRVSMLANVFVIFKLVIWGACALITITVGLRLWWTEMISSGNCSRSCKHFCGTICLLFCMLVAFAVCVLPVAIAQQCLCLSWLTILQSATSPSSNELPFLTMAHEFLWSSSRAPQPCAAMCGDERPIEVDWPATVKRLRDEAQEIYDLVKDAVQNERSELMTAALRKTITEKDLTEEELAEWKLQQERQLRGRVDGDYDDCSDDDGGGRVFVHRIDEFRKRVPRDRSRRGGAHVAVGMPGQIVSDPSGGSVSNEPTDDDNPLQGSAAAAAAAAAAAGPVTAGNDDNNNNGSIERKFYSPGHLSQQVSRIAQSRNPVFDGETYSAQLNWPTALLRVMEPKSRAEEGSEPRKDSFRERLRHIRQLKTFVEASTVRHQFNALLRQGPTRDPNRTLPACVSLDTHNDADDDQQQQQHAIHRARTAFGHRQRMRRRGPRSQAPVEQEDIERWLKGIDSHFFRFQSFINKARNTDDEEDVSTGDNCECPSPGRCFRMCCCQNGCRCRFEEGAMAVFALLSWVSSLLSLCVFIAYPCAYGTSHFSLMQWITGGICWGCLALCLLLLPAYWRYVKSCLLYQNYEFGFTHFFRHTPAATIDSYFSVSVNIISKLDLIRSEAVPADALMQHVLPFISSRSLEGLYGATKSELDKIKELMVQQHAEKKET